ncbi:alpha/beta hydrolase [Fundidesulfovibrio butyratiphilus]
MRHETFLTDDGCALNVLCGGQGEKAVLFVHGNSCDHTFLAPQIEYFARTHQVVAPDLRGHGKSDKPEGDYSFARLADDLAGVCLGLGLPPVAVVGHSMGGVVALEFSRRHPRLTAAVACLDTTVVSPPGRHGRLTALLEGLRSENSRSYFLRNFESAFLPTDDPGRRQAILERMLETPRHVTVSLFEQWRLGDGQAALSALRSPFLYVASSNGRSQVEDLSRLHPHVSYGQVVGSGHFLTLEVPDQVNAMLGRFFELFGL